MTSPSNATGQPWLAWAKRLHAIAATGAFYSDARGDAYDRERYDEIASIARDMLADVTRLPPDTLRVALGDYAERYVTPQVDVRGAVLRDDRVLLVKEKSDGRWTLPGGFAEVGHSPAENVEKEILEEANLATRAQALIGVRHKARHEYDADVRDFYKLFFLCEAIDGFEVAPGTETLDVGFFALDALPPLSTDRVLEKDLRAAFDYAATPIVFFD